MSEETKQVHAISTDQLSDSGSVSASSSDLELNKVTEKQADATLAFYHQYRDEAVPLTAEQVKKLNYKLYFYVLFLCFFISLMLYIDKAGLSYAAILGIFEDADINKTQYNNLNSFFYVGYIVSLWPGHYLMQRLPLSKFVPSVIFIWSVILFLHCTAKNYGGLIALRFFLGFTEAVMIPALEMTMGMFFDQQQNTFLQPIFWISCQSQNLPAGFMSYGALQSHNEHVHPWQLFMIILGGLTILLSVWCFFFYPDNPANARFLSTNEKIYLIEKVQRSTLSSIEQKVYKRHQAVEAVKDPISWLFALQAFTIMFGNNLSYQQNLIYVSIGVSSLGSTLVSAAAGGWSLVVCVFAAIHLKYTKGQVAINSSLYCIPAIAGGIAMITVPWDKKLGLLASLIMAGHTYGITYIVGLAWTLSSCSGYTKKSTRMVIYMIGYAIGSLVSPQIWVASDAPRYRPAWISTIVVSFIGTPTILLTIRFILSRRNKERKAYIESHENAVKGLVDEQTDSGEKQTLTVDVGMLDLTDLENKAFIYPL